MRSNSFLDKYLARFKSVHILLTCCIAMASCAGDDSSNPSNSSFSPNEEEFTFIPSNINVIHADQRCVLGWSQVVWADSNTVYWSTGTSTSIDTAENVLKLDRPNYSFDNLQNDTTYTFVVTSTMDGIESSATDPVSCTPHKEPFTDVVVGSIKSYGLRSDGSVWYWGGFKSTPLPLSQCSEEDTYSCAQFITEATQIFAAGSQVGVIASDGQLWIRGVYGYWIDDSGVEAVAGFDSVKSISVGDTHTLILKQDGTLWSIGTNEYGQLGVTGNDTCGDHECSLSPIRIDTLSDIELIASSTFHSLAMDSAGDVYTWGRNSDRQLGIATSEYCVNDTLCSKVPINIGNLGVIQQLAANFTSSYALLTNGSVRAWGGNRNGQLGNNSSAFSFTPVEVSGLNDAIFVAADRTSVVALRESGNVVSWGGGEFKAFTCCADVSRVPEFLYTSGDAIGVSIGYQNVALIDDQGIIKTVGRNMTGELGDGRAITSSLPLEVTGLPEINSVASSTSQNAITTYAIDVNSNLWLWGYNLANRFRGELYSATPAMLESHTGFASVSASANHAIAMKTDGSIWSWGSNYRGQLGIGSSVNTIETSLSPVCDSGQVEPCQSYFSGATMIVSGYETSVALKEDGTVWTWGGNMSGQLGNGTSANSVSPVQVCDVGESDPCANFLTQVKSVHSNGSAFFALKQDGTLVAWGTSDQGLLGENVETSNVPVIVPGIDGIDKIAVGKRHMLALKTDSTIWTWGLGARIDWQDYNGIPTPTQVPSLVNVTDISAGESKSMAKTADGRLWAWGLSSRGALFTQSDNYLYEPFEILPEFNIDKFSVDEASFVITRDGKLFGAGINYGGQLGDRSDVWRSTFGPVVGI